MALRQHWTDEVVPRGWQAAAIAAVFGVVAFLWEGLLGFNISDEGFLWYGAQRIVHGDVPLRDFMAYDPARYYWAAAFMALRGDSGLTSLWISVAVFQAGGLYLALASTARAGPKCSFAWLLLVAATLMLWMIPRHKEFDIVISIVLAAALVRVLESPVRKRLFWAGASVGLAALFNRNHSVYGFFGQGTAIALCCLGGPGHRGPVAVFGPWLLGIFAGFSPIFLLMVFSPGFAAAYWDSIVVILQIIAGSGSTNPMHLPVPWPWRAAFGSGQGFRIAGEVLLGCLYLGILAFAVVGIAAAAYRRWRGLPLSPLLVAGVFLTLPYANHAFARASVLTLAQSLFPLLLGLFGWLVGRTATVRWTTGAGALIVSALVALPAHPGWVRAQAGDWMAVELHGDRVEVNPGIAATFVVLQDLIARHAPAGQPFLATPYWPGAYALSDRQAPQYEIYALLPRDNDFETGEIARIAKARPRLVILQEMALDGRDELRFSRTHPLQYAYIRQNFQQVASPFADPSVAVYLPLSAPQAPPPAAR